MTENLLARFLCGCSTGQVDIRHHILQIVTRTLRHRAFVGGIGQGHVLEIGTFLRTQTRIGFGILTDNTLLSAFRHHVPHPTNLVYLHTALDQLGDNLGLLSTHLGLTLYELHDLRIGHAGLCPQFG